MYNRGDIVKKNMINTCMGAV